MRTGCCTWPPTSASATPPRKGCSARTSPRAPTCPTRTPWPACSPRPEPGTGDGWLARFAAEFPQAEHLALGVDAGREPAEVPPEFLAAGLEFERAVVLSCAAVQPPPRQNTEAEIRRLESDDDWEQSRDLGIRCYGDGGPYLERRVGARRRLTPSGRAAGFGAVTDRRPLSQLG